MVNRWLCLSYVAPAHRAHVVVLLPFIGGEVTGQRPNAAVRTRAHTSKAQGRSEPSCVSPAGATTFSHTL